MNVLRKTPKVLRLVPGIAMAFAIGLFPATPAQANPTCISGVSMQCHRYWQQQGYASEYACDQEEIPLQCPGCDPNNPSSPYCTIEL
jgi:hypothetical protein